LSSPQSQSIIDLPKILAVGIASLAATLLTSRFGVAGTLVGLVLSAMFLTFAADVLKVYLARIPGAVTTIPGGLRKKNFFRRVFEKMKIPFSKFGSLPRPRRRSILIGSVVAAGISILVGLIIVTALEFGVGKSLSCWVWDECATESSAESSRTSGGVSTLPSILGGAPSAGTSIPQEEEEEEGSPSNQQQQPGVQQQPGSSPGTLEAPSQEEEEAAPDDPSSVEPGQRQGPSGVPQEEEDQQQPSPGETPEEKQKGSINTSEG